MTADLPAGVVELPPGVMELPPGSAELLSRWHPAGLARLTGVGTKRRIAVRGPRGAGVGALTAELAAFSGIECDEAAADVVVWVVDAAAVITADELDAIDVVSAGGQSLVVAVNKIDVHPAWEAVVSTTARLVGQVSASIPVIGVSALLAQLGRLTGAEPTQSGLPALVAAIASSKALASDQVHTVVVAEAIANLERELARVDADEAALRGRRINLVSRRDGGRASALGAAKAKVQLARVGLLHDVTDAVRAASQRMRTRIEHANVKALRDGGALTSEIADELLAEVARRAHERLGGLEAEDLDLTRIVMPSAPPRRSRGAEDGLMVVLGASAGFGIGRLAVAPLALVPAADIATMPAALGLGGAVAWWFVRMRSLGADRVHVRAWANDALASMKSQLEQVVHARLVGLETTLAAQVLAASTRNAVAVDQELVQLEAEIRKRGPNVGRRREELAADLAALHRMGSDSCTDGRG